MKIKLRPDQALLVEQVITNIQKNNLIVSPSGSGKSYIMVYLEKLLSDQGYTVNLYAPTIEVREQLEELLKFNGSNNYVRGIVSDLKEESSPDFLLIDEAHHSEAESYQKLFDKFPDAVRIGFSATPHRLDGKGLDNSYENIIIGNQVQDLIDSHVLSKYRYFAPSVSEAFQNSVSDKFLKIGKEQFFQAVQRSGSYRKTLYADIVKTWKEKGENKQTILFAPSIEMSKKFAKEFQNAGVIAKHIDGKTPIADRKEILESFRRHDIKMICNVDLISEGFDMSDADCVILTRPTESLAMFMQQAFRALRYREGKVAVILDHADNIALHGELSAHREWSLEGKKDYGSEEGYKRTIWERWNNDAVFDTSVELSEVIKNYNSQYDKKIDLALKKRDFEGFKLLVEIEQEAKIVSVGKYSWAYSFALENGFKIPILKG